VEHGAGLALICPTYLYYMVKIKKNKLFKNYCLQMGKVVFGTNDIKGYFNALSAFIKLLGLPTKYTDFEQIKEVTDADIAFLNQHFNKQTNNKKEDVGKYVFSHIKK
jgi:alcohol dehydrogenase YqhD (iron-dependent ADH family)